MIIVGHRGAAGRFPENTLASIQEAVSLGLDWVEVDIQPTLDNHLVVCHDHTIDRCSNGKGRLDELTLNELKTYDFGSWFDSSFKDERILTLPELLTIAKSHNLSLNLEIKIDRHDPSKVCDLVQEAIEQHDVSHDKVIFSSFNHEVIRQLRARMPKARLGVLSERLKPADKALLSEVSAFSCNLNYKTVTNSQISHLKKDGYQVWCYTVNNPNSIKFISGLDAIFSDFPERFL